jgi:hypothetical protein
MEEAFLRRLFPETIAPVATAAATGGQPAPRSPVDVILAIREDMARFQKIGGDKPAFKETLREVLRKELRAQCMEALQRSATAAAAAAHEGGASAGGQRRPNRRPNAGPIAGYPNIEPIVEYLQERGANRPKLPRAQVRRLAKSVLAEKASQKTSEGTSKKESGEKESGS